MKLKTFISTECANYVVGKCVDNRCFALEKRCKYFEKCLLPLKEWTKHPKHKEWDIATGEYKFTHIKHNGIR